MRRSKEYLRRARLINAYLETMEEGLRTQK